MIGNRTSMALIPVIGPAAALVLPPRHPHDCECCHYVGRADCSGESDMKHDVYLCEDEGVTTIIARYGSDADYGSFPLEVAQDVARTTGGFWEEITTLHKAWVAGQRILLGED